MSGTALVCFLMSIPALWLGGYTAYYVGSDWGWSAGLLPYLVAGYLRLRYLRQQAAQWMAIAQQDDAQRRAYHAWAEANWNDFSPYQREIVRHNLFATESVPVIPRHWATTRPVVAKRSLDEAMADWKRHWEEGTPF